MSSRRGRRITDAEIARETGKRRWGDDVSRWPMKERALYDRLRKHMNTPLDTDAAELRLAGLIVNDCK